MIPHGTLGGYNNHDCRCAACRAAKTRQQNAWRARQRSRSVPDHVHGTQNGYCNYSCRCDLCRKAVAIAQAERRLSQKVLPLEGVG